MKNKHILVLTIVAALALVGLLVAATRAWARTDGLQALAPVAPAAVVSNTMSFQGRLLDSGGNPVEGAQVLTFRLYTTTLGGSSLWSQTGSVPVDDGLFTAHLNVNPALFNGQALWLGVQVQGDAQELSPRQPLLPVPYALALPGLWTQQNITSPNLVGGYSGNTIAAGVEGAAIGGGGNSSFLNRVTDNYGTVGGGVGNQAGNGDSDVGNAGYATVGGGWDNSYQ